MMAPRSSVPGPDPSPFRLDMPARIAAPVLFNSPHSGGGCPPEFLAQTWLGLHDLRRSADLHVDRLIEDVGGFGLPVMRMQLLRSFIDVNREPLELDPAMFRGAMPASANITSARVAAGYGIIPRLVSDQLAIYQRPWPIEEALARIDRWYRPYHHALETVVSQLQAAFGSAVIIDCHSMPSASLPRNGADVVLGNRHGKSCGAALTDLARSCFEELGFTVACNLPYAGGYITEHYGVPAQGRQVLQVEVNRALYMDETTYAPHRGLDEVKAAMTALAHALVADWQMRGMRAAAE